MDRWRSGTPETCHSSHHHAVCTRSGSLSLSLQVFFLFLFFFILIRHLSSLSLSLSLHPSSRLLSLNRRQTSRYLPFIHSFAVNSEKQSVVLFLPAIFLFFFFLVAPSLSPSLLLLWQSFLGFIISSGDIPPSFSPFSPSLPLSLSLSQLFLSAHFHFLSRKKNLSLSLSLLCLSLMDQIEKV